MIAIVGGNYGEANEYARERGYFPTGPYRNAVSIGDPRDADGLRPDEVHLTGHWWRRRDTREILDNLRIACVKMPDPVPWIVDGKLIPPHLVARLS